MSGQFAPYPNVYGDNSMPIVTRSPVQTMRYPPYASFIQYPSPDHQVISFVQGQPDASINTGLNKPVLQGLSPYKGPMMYPIDGHSIGSGPLLSRPYFVNEQPYLSDRQPSYPQPWNNPPFMQPMPNIQRQPEVRITINGRARETPAYPINSSLPDPYLLGYLGIGPLY